MDILEGFGLYILIGSVVSLLEWWRATMGVERVDLYPDYDPLLGGDILAFYTLTTLLWPIVGVFVAYDALLTAITPAPPRN